MAYPRDARGTLEERFWAKVDRRGPDECWSWMAALAGGYGRINQEGRIVLAHRLSLELHGIKIPDGMKVDHLCHDPELCAPPCLHRRCVNPRHLQVTTQKVNVLRGGSPQARNAKKTHCPKNHPYDEANTYLDPKGYRVCRECGRVNRNARRRQRRERSDQLPGFQVPPTRFAAAAASTSVRYDVRLPSGPVTV